MSEYDTTILKRVGHTFMTSDPGGKRDWFACVVWKIGRDNDNRKVLVAIDSMRAKLSGRKTRGEIYESIVKVYNKHKNKRFIIEANGLGAPIADTLQNNYGLKNQIAVTVVNRIKRDEYNQKSNVLDINEIIQQAHIMIENATLLCYDSVDIELRKQTLAYVKKISQAGNIQYRAGTGHDDYVSCLRLAVFYATKIADYPEQITVASKKFGYGYNVIDEFGSGVPQHLQQWQAGERVVIWPE